MNGTPSFVCLLTHQRTSPTQRVQPGSILSEIDVNFDDNNWFLLIINMFFYPGVTC